MIEKKTKDVFITDDGTEFDDEGAAQMHEEWQAAQREISRFLAGFENKRSRAIAKNILEKFARFKIGLED